MVFNVEGFRETLPDIVKFGSTKDFVGFTPGHDQGERPGWARERAGEGPPPQQHTPSSTLYPYQCQLSQAAGRQRLLLLLLSQAVIHAGGQAVQCMWGVQLSPPSALPLQAG